MSKPSDQNSVPPGHSTPPTHIVGIGASAGGLNALGRFCARLPKQSGMAFVIVQHLSPDFKSIMNELLARYTDLPIKLIEQDTPLQADTIYLNLPTVDVVLDGNILRLRKHVRSRAPHHPIDTLLESLAEQVGQRGIGAVSYTHLTLPTSG